MKLMAKANAAKEEGKEEKPKDAVKVTAGEAKVTKGNPE